MDLAPRFVGRLGVADAVTVGNAALGFLAAALATTDVAAAARLVLLAAVLDGLDGVLARRYGGTPAGPYLDSLADVASFGVAPAMLAVTLAVDGVTEASAVIVFGIPALFVAMAVVRLGLYTAYDAAHTTTLGAPSTLAATALGAAVLAGIEAPAAVLAITVAFCYLMVSSIEYPDLLARDAVLMGVVHVLAVLIPGFQGGMFPVALVTLSLAYLLLGPWLYWGEAERAGEGKRS
ncbi:protein sorting system archaetidylserine synthase [Halalkalicoccus jeotgali]|uniref:CDP-alcohol phosphatidyltransferase n=1 Tax=Halalkalicoccus jeotgali (strain DSM 18796 / CECT 7217 / JCM 14584 / KCTC 4019 / B3) TaxID=795797 RepID=D8J4S9_HALJB|nr:protein sorting system archaetidylserine synthase [Halalkalicoccus jeotgali]ADJ15546.1 CDP-alcohol phosphatidyltransferase [Halalkalicoccus jeotgali B3]ELY36045.1 CDP-alcohol phosphatidyltransferase [Halalkalicoccus jeotgali B3]